MPTGVGPRRPSAGMFNPLPGFELPVHLEQRVLALLRQHPPFRAELIGVASGPAVDGLSSSRETVAVVAHACDKRQSGISRRIDDGGLEPLDRLVLLVNGPGSAAPKDAARVLGD